MQHPSLPLEERINAFKHCTELTFMQCYGKLVELKVRLKPSDTVHKDLIPDVFYDDLERYNTMLGGYGGEAEFSATLFSQWFDHVYYNGTSYPIHFKTQVV